MSWFEYDGLTAGETAVQGRIQASDSEHAVKLLKNMHIELREIHAIQPEPKTATRLKPDALVFFNKQLASLAKAGIALDKGLEQIARDIESPKVKKWVDSLVDDVRAGTPIDQAIARQEQGLPVLYSNVIRAGIKTGDLHTALMNVNQHLTLVGKTRKIFWEAASYPAVVAGLALIILSFFFVYVIPQFKSIFFDFDVALPGLTMLLLGFADAFPFILVTIGVIAGLSVFAWHGLKASPKGLKIREKIILALPVYGKLYHTALIARFLRSVSTSIDGSNDLPSSIRLAAQATGSPLLTDEADKLSRDLEKGKPVLEAIAGIRLIPAIFGLSVQSAIGRNAVPESVQTLSETYESKVEYSLSMLQTILFPIFVVVLGALLGFCVIAILLPLISLINSISGG